MSSPDIEEKFLSFKLLGNENFKSKRYSLAAKNYTSAIATKPDESVAYCNRAMCYIHLEMHFEALEDCNKAIELDPTAVKAFYRRALALKELHRYQMALDDLRMVSRLDPDLSLTKKEMDNIECLLMSDTRIELKPMNKPTEYRSDKTLKTFNLLNQYTGSKLYNS